MVSGIRRVSPVAPVFGSEAGQNDLKNRQGNPGLPEMDKGETPATDEGPVAAPAETSSTLTDMAKDPYAQAIADEMRRKIKEKGPAR